MDSRTRAARGWASAMRSGLPSRGERLDSPRHPAGAPGQPGAPAFMTRALGRRRSARDEQRGARRRARRRGPALLAAPRGDRRTGRGGARRQPGAGTRGHCRRSRSVRVVGSGPIAWGKVAVRSAPRRDAAVVTHALAVPAGLPSAHGAGARRAPRTPRVWRPGTGSPCRAGRTAARAGSPRRRPIVAPVDRWLVVYRGSRKFELYVDGRLRRTGPVAVGAPRHGDADRPLLRAVAGSCPASTRSSGRSRSRRAATRSSPTGRAAASSASTARIRRG